MAEQRPSGVWLDDSDAQQRERLAREEAARSYQDRYKFRVQFLIVDALIDLRERLGQLEQTTMTCPTSGDIADVLAMIQKCWDAPTASTATHLSQEIGHLVANWSKT